MVLGNPRRCHQPRETARDPLDVDTTILHRFSAVRDLDQRARDGVGIAEGTTFDEFHAAVGADDKHSGPSILCFEAAGFRDNGVSEPRSMWSRDENY